MILAVVSSILILPYFNKLTDLSLDIPWTDISFIVMMIGIPIVIGLGSGWYPAKHLVIRVSELNRQTTSNGTFFLRNFLVLTQLIMAIVVSSVAYSVHDLYEFYMNKPLGYDRSNILYIEGLDMLTSSHRQHLHNEMSKLAEVEYSSMSDFLPVFGTLINNKFYWKKDSSKNHLGKIGIEWVVDKGYNKTMSINIVDGRDFHDFTDENKILLSKSMVDQLKLSDPIGRTITTKYKDYEIIGVFEDFHFESMVRFIRPMTMVLGEANQTLILKTSKKLTLPLLQKIERKWASVAPNVDFRYSVLQDKFIDMYNTIHVIRILLIGFSVIAFYLCYQSIMSLLNTDQNLTRGLLELLKIMIPSGLIAIPLSWFLLQELKEHVFFRPVINWKYFGIPSGVLFMFILGSCICKEVLKNFSKPT